MALPGVRTYMDFRDGQKRPVFIYRFLTTGAIDGMSIVTVGILEKNLISFQRKSINDR